MGSGDQSITNHGYSLLSQGANVVVPSDILISETVDQSVGQTQLVLEFLSLVLDSLLVETEKNETKIRHSIQIF